MGDTSNESAGQWPWRTGMFSASRNSVPICATWARALSCCNMFLGSCFWMNGTIGLRISSCYLSTITKFYQATWRWTCSMWRCQAGVATPGLRLLGLLDILPNSLKPPSVKEMNTGNISGGRSCSHHTSRLWTGVICGIVLSKNKVHIPVWPFIVASRRHICVIIM